MLYIVFRINLSQKSSCVLSNSEINYKCKLRLVGKLSRLHPEPNVSLFLPPSVIRLCSSSFPAFPPTEARDLLVPGLTELKKTRFLVSLLVQKKHFKRFNIYQKRNHVHENSHRLARRAAQVEPKRKILQATVQS